MLQDIAPYTYCNAMRFAPPDPDDLVLACAPGGVFAKVESGMLILPTVGQCTGISRWTYAFSIDRTRYFLPGQLPQVPGFSLISHYRALGPKQTVYALSLIHI